MGNNPYNGFGAILRRKGGRWLHAEMAAGRADPRPVACDVCGRRDGTLAWHSENYSEPFGDHIGEYGLCFCCHMLIHCRYKSQAIFKRYHLNIQHGLMTTYPIDSWYEFSDEVLKAGLKQVAFAIRPGVPPERTLLDALSLIPGTPPDDPPRGSRRCRQIGLF